MELRQYFALFRRWWWLIVLLTALGAGTAFGLAQFREPVYEATARLLLSPSSEALPDVNAVTSGQRVAETYSELILQRDVLAQVAGNLGLSTSPDALADRARVNTVSGTNILELTVQDADPQQAADIANEIALVFIEKNQSRQAVRFSVSRQEMEQDVTAAQNKLVDLSTQVDQIRSETDILRSNLLRVEGEINTMENRLDEIPGDIAIAQASLDAIDQLPGSNTDVAIVAQRGRLQQEISQLNAEQARLEQRLPEKRADRDEWDAQLAQLLQQLNPLEIQLLESQSQYESLLNSYQELRVTEARGSDYMSIVQEAIPPDALRQTSAMVLGLQGAMVGAALGFGAVLLIEYLNDTVRSEEQAEQATGAATLGVIGRIQEVDNPGDALVTVRHPRSSNAEAFRVLRANLDALSKDAPVRSIVVSSTGPMEGKTTTAANLGVALAQAGKQVILVDTDLRRPTLHKLFDVSNRRGVTTALLQPAIGTVNDHLLATGVENLRLMPSGPLPPNPADMLESPHMAELIEELQSCADVVIFDSPPVLAVADPSLLARLCDMVLLVVLAEQTKTAALTKAAEQLTQAGGGRLGIVLNRVSASHDGYYYRYHYYYASEVENGTKS